MLIMGMMRQMMFHSDGRVRHAIVHVNQYWDDDTGAGEAEVNAVYYRRR